MTSKPIDLHKQEMIEWLSGALIRAALSPSALSRKIGCSRQAVTYWLNTGCIAIKQVPLIEKAVGELSPLTLSAQTNIYTVDRLEPSCAVSRNQLTDIPLVSWREAGNIDLTSWKGDTVVISFENDDRRLFALQMRTNTMLPTFNKGDVIYIDERKPRNGDHVIVRFKDDDEAVLRDYSKSGGKISLTCDSSANQDFFNLTEDSFDYIGVCIGKFTKFD